MPFPLFFQTSPYKKLKDNPDAKFDGVFIGDENLIDQLNKSPQNRNNWQFFKYYLEVYRFIA